MRASRVRKLLALAEDRAGTPEGETAARLARRLLREHQQELAGLSLEEQDRVDPFVRRELLLGGSAHWRCRLFCAVALHCGCVAGYRPGAGVGWLYGRQGAVEVAEHLYLVLARALTHERVMFLFTRGAGLGELERDRAANNFCQSAILALESRMQQQREQERDLAPEGFALLAQRNQGLRDWMRRQGHQPRRSVPFAFTLSEDGYQAGWRLPLQDAVTGEREGGA